MKTKNFQLLFVDFVIHVSNINAIDMSTKNKLEKKVS